MAKAIVLPEGTTVAGEEAAVAVCMSREEALFITAVLARIGGSCTNSPRKYSQAVYDQLIDAGFEYTERDEYRRWEREHFTRNSKCLFKDPSDIWMENFKDDKE